MRARHTVTYLYSDGHAVVLYERQDPQAGLIEWVEVYEKWTEGWLSFEGRVIIGRYSGALAQLCRRAIRIRATEPKIEAGSEGTRAKGILFGTLEVEGKDGSLYFHDMPGTISGPYTYQPDQKEAFDSGITKWGWHKVSKVHMAKVPEMAGAK